MLPGHRSCRCGRHCGRHARLTIPRGWVATMRNMLFPDLELACWIEPKIAEQIALNRSGAKADALTAELIQLSTHTLPRPPCMSHVATDPFSSPPFSHPALVMNSILLLLSSQLLVVHNSSLGQHFHQGQTNPTRFPPRRAKPARLLPSTDPRSEGRRLRSPSRHPSHIPPDLLGAPLARALSVERTYSPLT